MQDFPRLCNKEDQLLATDRDYAPVVGVVVALFGQVESCRVIRFEVNSFVKSFLANECDLRQACC